MSEKARENRLRRQAQRLGLILKKSKARNWNIDDHQGWMVVDGQINGIIQGEKFNLSLEEVEAFLNEYEKTLR